MDKINTNIENSATDNPDGTHFESVRDVNRQLIAGQNTNPDTLTQTRLSSSQTASTQSPQQNQTQNSVNLDLKGKIMKEMSLNRKSEGYQAHKGVQDQVLNAARQHVLCMNLVMEQLDKRIQLSDRSLQAIAQFLKDRIQQEQNNVRMLTNKNPSFIHIYKVTEQPVYPKLTASLEYLNQLHQAQGKSLTLLITNMEKMIKEKFETNQQLFTKQIQSSQEKIASMRKQLKDIQSIIAEKIKKFGKIYDEMMQHGGSHKKRTKDLFNQERKFRHQASQALILQSKIGEEIINLYNEVIKQETQRIEIIVYGLRYYIEKFHETYSGTTPSAQVQLVLQKFKDYNPLEETNTLNLSDFQFIKDALKCQEVGFPQLKAYLIQFPTSILKPTLAQTHPLILKFFSKIQRDNGTVLTSWQPIIVVVSIDQNLLLFDSDDTTIPNSKAQFKFAIENTALIVKSNKGQLICELKHTIPGMIYNSHKSVTLKFNSQDEYDELQFYLNQNKR